MIAHGWHFIRATKKLGYGDNRLVRRGTLVYRGDEPIELCERGLHASRRALDAVNYAPGPIVCRVRLDGEIKEGDDKMVATRRTVLWLADATDLLFEFSCWVAEAALIGQITQGFAVHPDSYAALVARRKFQRGEIAQAELSAAESAAESAAWSAAESAARSAARSAAESAARSAARSAAESAAWSAARSAAEDLQNAELERRLWTLKPKGVRRA